MSYFVTLMSFQTFSSINCGSMQVCPATCIKLVDKSLDNQLASVNILLQTFYHQAIQTHPNIGLMTGRQQGCSKLAAICAFCSCVVSEISYGLL